MTFTATPEPANVPPRVLLDIDSDVSGATFTSLTVTRDGVPLMQQPATGAENVSVYDYTAPFGQSVEYIADGEYLPFVAPDWTETWASLAAWTGDTGSWSLVGGATVGDDAFTRADSATTLGSATTGGAWTAQAGTWGISSNTGYCPTGVGSDYATAVLSTAASDCTVEVTFPTVDGGGNTGLVVRSNSSTTGFAVLAWGMWDIGTDLQVGGSYSANFVSGDRMRVVMAGTSIEVFRQVGAVGAWTSVHAVSSSSYQTNTKHGLTVWGTGATTARFDNFLVTTSSGVSSSTANATIVRSASGTIQRVNVQDPDYIRLEVVTAGDVVVASVAVTSNIVLTGTSAKSVAGSGSFELNLTGGTATATGDTWTVTRPYTGTPTKVRIVSLGGSYVESASFSSVGAPGYIAVGSTHFYVKDQSAATIRKFTHAGTFVTSWATTGIFAGMAVDASENVYVLDSTSNLVRKYNSSGTPGVTWSTTGTPTGIGIDSSLNVYVCDYSNDLVRKFGVGGSPLTTWAFTATPASGLAVNAGGTVMVWAEDDATPQVQSFNSTGTLLNSFSPSSSVGTNPRGTIDTASNVYLGKNSTVYKFTNAGTAAGSTTISPDVIGAIAIKSGTDLVVGDATANTIRTFAPTTGSVDEIVTTGFAETSHFREIATTTLTVDEAWLIHPSSPALSVSIDPGPNLWRGDGINVAIESAQTTVAKAAQTLHYPIGRARAVAIGHGNRLDDEWELVLNTPRIEDRDSVKAIVRDQTPLLVRSPPAFEWDLADGFYAVQDVDTSRPFAPLQFPDRQITLPLVPSDPPVIRSSTERTYADLLLEASTYADLMSIYDTYTDVLTGSA